MSGGIEQQRVTMPQLTLVALYGDKSLALSSFISSCQGMTSAALGPAFRPYDLRQVHATIIGLEHSAGLFPQNANFWRLRGQRTLMDLSGYLGSLGTSSELPFNVQIAGFAEQDRPFSSRGASPFERGFSIRGDKAVLMGWPCAIASRGMPKSYPRRLDSIRRRAQEFGILHAYHRSETDLDNDFFFRIGLVDRRALSRDAASELEHELRRHMSRLGPLMVNVGPGDLQVAAYRDERLPLSSTRVWPPNDPELHRKIGSLVGACAQNL
jgi:hypothetical protein